MTGRIWLACLAVAVALVAIPWTLWPFAIFAAAVAVAMVQTVRVRSLRKRLAASEDRAETFADEICSVHAANEILCAELAASDEKIRRLSNDLLAAQMLASDAREELAAAPAPVIPLPVVREASPYDWPIADGHFPVHTEIHDDDLTAPMRATEEN